MIKRTHLTALLAAGVIAVAGCGGDSKTKAADIPAGPAPEAPPAPKASTNLKDTKSKPTIPRPTGKPPTKLEVKDIVKGTGPPAKKGDQLSMNYVGVTFSTGTEFDASWDRGQPFDLALGQGDVIKGWDLGLVGIRKGGRRELTIPAKLAYGAQGRPPDIGPNEPLVFIVDAVKVSAK